MKLIISQNSDLIKRGNYRFVGPFRTHEETINDCESLTGFAVVATGDLAASIVTSPLLSGAACIKLTYQSALNDRLELTGNIKKTILKIRLYVRSARRGSYLTLGVGESSWSEHTQTVPINVSNQFELVEFDFSSVDTEINKIALRIDDNSGLPNNIYIDRILAVRKTNRHYDMRMSQIKYKFDSKKLEASCEFGPYPPAMENFIAELIKYAEKNDSSAEQR